jgi:hypothetical protein
MNECYTCGKELEKGFQCAQCLDYMLGISRVKPPNYFKRIDEEKEREKNENRFSKDRKLSYPRGVRRFINQ